MPLHGICTLEVNTYSMAKTLGTQDFIIESYCLKLNSMINSAKAMEWEIQTTIVEDAKLLVSGCNFFHVCGVDAKLIAVHTC